MLIITGGSTTVCKPCTALDTYENKQSAAPRQCENTESLLTCDGHSTALDQCKDCGSCGCNHNNVAEICSVERRYATECGCGPDSAVRTFEGEKPKCNAGSELAGIAAWQCNERGAHVHKNEPRNKLTESRAPGCDLRCGSNDPELAFRRANAAGCEFSGWNVPESEFQREEVRDWEFPEWNDSESEFRRQNLRDRDCPGVVGALPFMPPCRGAERGLATGIDVGKSGCSGKAFPEIGLTGNCERIGQRYIPPTLAPPPFVTKLNSRHDACHTCIKPFVC